MSKTALEAVKIVYQHLQNSILFTDPKKPTGKLYQYQRPDNSRAEDVVVNSLTLNRDTVQAGVLNVNLFVPNLSLPFSTGTDNNQPNIARLVELAQLANTALNEVWGNGYFFEVQQDNLFTDTNNQHYLNFRVTFKSLNIKEN